MADRGQKTRRWLRRALLFLLTSYLVVVLGMWFLENRLVYFPATAEELWQPPPDPRIEEVWIEAAIEGCDRLHGWWLPLEGVSETVMICHGNAGNLSTRGPSLARFADGLERNVLIFDYPGYGKSPGSPDESKCYESARAAFRWLTDTKGYPADRLVIYGESLGGGVGVQLATELDHQALVLMKTFTALPDVAAEMYPWLPVRWLMRNRYDNVSKIAKCPRPILIAGGTADSLVPFRHSQHLFELAHEPKHFRALEGSEHNDSLPPDFIPEMRQFLENHRPRNGR